MSNEQMKQERQLETVQQEPSGSAGVEGGLSPTGGPAEPRHRQRRWSSRKKQDLVLRLLRGETLDELSRETGLPASRIAGWRDASLAAMETALLVGVALRGDGVVAASPAALWTILAAGGVYLAACALIERHPKLDTRLNVGIVLGAAAVMVGAQLPVIPTLSGLSVSPAAVSFDVRSETERASPERCTKRETQR